MNTGVDATEATRGSAGRGLALAVAAAALLGAAGLAADAFFYEPNAVEISHQKLPAPALGKPVKIAFFADLHATEVGPRETKVIELVQAARPDLIAIAGDVVAEGTPLEVMAPFFRNLSAPLGIWVVRGESERGIEAPARFYETVGVRYLENFGAQVREDLWVAGLDDPLTGKPDIQKALKGAPAAAFKVVLFHAPDYFTDVSGLFDLGLAGHTHGGQIRLPGYGPLSVPSGGQRYPVGWFTEARSALFVTRGIGTVGTPARLFCRPEVAIIEIHPGG